MLNDSDIKSKIIIAHWAKCYQQLNAINSIMQPYAIGMIVINQIEGILLVIYDTTWTYKVLQV